MVTLRDLEFFPVALSEIRIALKDYFESLEKSIVIFYNPPFCILIIFILDIYLTLNYFDIFILTLAETQAFSHIYILIMSAFKL